MKTLSVVLAGLLALVSADTEPAQVTPTPTTATNTTASHGAHINTAAKYYCETPPGATRRWYRLNKSNGPYEYTIAPLDREWSMLRSYRDGGVENIHWKYTENQNDPECMENWNYHAADGRTLKTYVAGRTTTYGLNRRWCGLPVYNDGGVQGYQWEVCKCRMAIPIGKPTHP